MKDSTVKIIFFFCFLGIQLHAQTNYSKYAPNLMKWLKNNSVTSSQKHQAITFNINNVQYLSAFIKVNNKLVEDEILNLGVVIRTKAGDIWTVSIPEQKMRSFVIINGIDYIELDYIVKPVTDSARFVTGVDSVHAGINLPFPLSGKNVVVGVVDDGFDHTHPTFYDTTYSNLRIKKVWNQGETGTPPSNYNYGSEWTDSNSILEKKYTTFTEADHGTTTSSVAAGSGYGSQNNSVFRGVAFESDVVLVGRGFDYLETRGMAATRLIDAFNYIFNYANSVGKPSVINVSLVGWLGPRDGTSLFAQACDNLSAPGKILVFAAGNNGLDKLHLEKTFTNTDTIVSTIATMPLNENYFEIWGEVNKTFCIEIGLFTKGVLGAKTQRFCIDSEVHSTFLIGEDNDTSFITITSSVNVLNNKPVLVAEIIHKTKDSLYLSVIGNSGTIHVFDEEWGQFTGNGSWAIDGDSRYTISELACAKSIITVSAFASKLKFKNLQNQEPIIPATIAKNNGELALFSSIGPTIDGRMKPEIAAPGCAVVSATNSYSPTYRQGGPLYYTSVARYLSPKNNRTYYYTASTGTSVAAPIVTGIVALMLQVNPNLSPKEIKDILIKTAKKDEFTTQFPDTTRWGAGKVNGYAAIKETIIITGTVNVPKNEMDVQLFPNPNIGKFTIEFESDKEGYFLVEVTNVLGEQISQQAWKLSTGKNQLPIELNAMNKGVYFVTITGFGGQITKKIVIE